MIRKHLQVVHEEPDLGLTISSDLSRTKTCNTVWRKARYMLWFIARNFSYDTCGNIIIARLIGEISLEYVVLIPQLEGH